MSHATPACAVAAGVHDDNHQPAGDDASAGDDHNLQCHFGSHEVQCEIQEEHTSEEEQQQDEATQRTVGIRSSACVWLLALSQLQQVQDR